MLAPVAGTVLLDGKPLSHAYVTFTPEQGRAATGRTGVDGTFVLGTFATNDGALIGRHQATVVARETTDAKRASADAEADAMKLPGRSRIPAKYENTATSGFTFEVKEGMDNQFQLVLHSRVEKSR
ncbi:MAG: hypothetical protein IT427_16830 [Pirellulales bacterium]|nr:hypothetical protein [Pirellulales bacterium]